MAASIAACLIARKAKRDGADEIELDINAIELTQVSHCRGSLSHECRN